MENGKLTNIESVSLAISLMKTTTAQLKQIEASLNKCNNEKVAHAIRNTIKSAEESETELSYFKCELEAEKLWKDVHSIQKRFAEIAEAFEKLGCDYEHEKAMMIIDDISNFLDECEF